MSWFSLIIAIVLIGATVGFLGLAVASTPAGQMLLLALVGGIATYWTMLASHNHFV